MVVTAEDWLQKPLPGLGFSHYEDIITLQRRGTGIPPTRKTPVTIRPINAEDIPAIVNIDRSAFAPPWRLTSSEISQALRVAANCTAALHNRQIVGYQLSTYFQQDAHLARLAVHPTMQNQGIAGALLRQLLDQLHNHKIYTLTVNTQRNNRLSQKLYQRYAFVPTGHNLSVWAIRL